MHGLQSLLVDGRVKVVDSRNSIQFSRLSERKITKFSPIVRLFVSRYVHQIVTVEDMLLCILQRKLMLSSNFNNYRLTRSILASSNGIGSINGR